MSTLRRSGYVLILLGAFNLALTVFAARFHITSWSGMFVVLWCFGFGFYFLRKGWNEDVR